MTTNSLFRYAGLVTLAVAAWLHLGGSLPDLPVRPQSDAVSTACDEYERLFRVASADVAEKLGRGELSTEQASRDYRAEALKQALKIAFRPLAQMEAEKLQGKWTPQVEAEILKGYARDSSR